MVFLPSNLGFLFLSRCLIFKVQSLSSLEDSSTSISHILAVVNTFLKVFSKNFLTFFACLSCCRGKLAYNITSFLLCQQFFETFFKFFQKSASLRTLIRVFLCVCFIYALYIGLHLLLHMASLYIDIKKRYPRRSIPIKSLYINLWYNH